MFKGILRPFLAAGAFGVFSGYPAIADLVTQFITSNQLLDPETAYVSLSFDVFF
jgi:hypothetical protein